ncbi:MAG TPA: ribbon-helix-helix protein, CopG family [Bryobacteraceae bacterium]|nr:ribbon-helix-helix protein, CopG family [Bryobacteraceae bacterium]
MAAVKITVTLDETSVALLNEIASRLAKPKSQVLREAIREYHVKSDRLSETERRRMLGVVDQIMKMPPTRSQAEVDRELRELRESRRKGWRRPSDVR